jgi:hypothetical protein
VTLAPSLHCRGRASLVLLLGLSAFSCGSTARYVVTASPIDALGIRQLRFCIAVEPSNPQGVWYWHPVRSDCSTPASRSSLIQGHRAKVMLQASGAIEASFEVPMQSGDSRQVEIVFSDGTVRASPTGDSVATVWRQELETKEF